MLDKISPRVPLDTELDELVDLLARAVSELDVVEACLRGLGGKPDGSFHRAPLTTEEAWRLAHFATECGFRGEVVREQAGRIVARTHGLFEARRDEVAVG